MNLVYVTEPMPLPKAEVVIIPGTKNTIEDLVWLRRAGYEQAILEHRGRGGPVIGVCGGYQMLGQRIEDPFQVESSRGSVEGLGLLPVTTVMAAQKTIRQVKARPIGPIGWPGEEMVGYEIHMGLTERTGPVGPVFVLERNGEEVLDGAVSPDGLVWGTYLHGLFDNDGFRRWLVKELFQRQGKQPPSLATTNYAARKEASFNALAELLRRHLDIEALYKIIGL